MRWRPDPATLRWLVNCELIPLHNERRHIEAMMTAVPLVEFSDDHCAEMRKRLGEIGAESAPQQHSEAAE